MAEPHFTTEELQNEVWRPVTRFDAFYEVSTLGRVRRPAGKFPWRPTAKLLKAYTNEKGYKRIGLRVPGGKQVKVYLHQIVADAFHGPCPDGMEINHRDLDKGNNRASNLEYLTRRQNMDHALAAGRFRGPYAGTWPI